MKNKFIIFLFWGTIISTTVFAQDSSAINHLDERGMKEGLWKLNRKYRLIETYYKGGIESGVYKEYNQNGRLLCFGEYKDGKMHGIWYYFDTDGHLMTILKNFAANTDTIVNGGDNKKYVPDYMCYSISFFPNGHNHNEGKLLWSKGEHPLSDFAIKFGEWKYYNSKGQLIKDETNNIP